MEEEKQVQVQQIPYHIKLVEEIVALQPNDLRDTKTQIKTILKKKLFKYNIYLGGVVINHKKIKIQSDRAQIHDEQPEIFFPVQYKAGLFKPQIGEIIPGVITQVFQSHIGVLIFNVFNAIINSNDLSAKIMKYNSDGEWVDSKSGESIEIGTAIQFFIKEIKIEENGDFQIEGTMQNSKRTGIQSNLKEKYLVEPNEQLIEDINTNMENLI